MLLMYGTLLGYMYFNQDTLMFNRLALRDDYQFELPLDFEEVTIERPGGTLLHGLVFKAEKTTDKASDNASDEANGTVLFFKGNAGHVGHSDYFARRFTGKGYNFVLFDYPGFGKSKGTLNGPAMLDDALALHDWTAERFGSGPLHIVGYSMGSAFASHVAAERTVAGLILFAPYHSIIDMSERRFPLAPAVLLRSLPADVLKFPFDNQTSLERVSENIVIVHGDNDQVIPIESSAQLVPALKSGDVYLPVKGATHASVTRQEQVWKAVDRLIP